VPASGEARLRLLQATRPVQPLRNLDRAAELGRFLDMPTDRARAILEKAANPAAWEPAPFPGLHLLHLVAGPAYAGADAGLVRFDANTPFPTHSHDGDEHTLMLEGGITFTDGRQLLAGQSEHMRPGLQHGFTVNPDGCLYAQILYVGIDIPGLGKVSLKKH
jgi:quercetin dioxygenase-like cupin family protein